jgi:hypothetical protein
VTFNTSAIPRHRPRRGKTTIPNWGRKHRWRRERYLPALEEVPERRFFQTDIGIDVKELYSPTDLSKIGFDYLRDLGFPGE